MFIYQEEIFDGFSRDPHFSHKIWRIRNQELFKQTHQALFDELTIRERKIIQLVANDYNNPQIAMPPAQERNLSGFQSLTNRWADGRCSLMVV